MNSTAQFELDIDRAAEKFGLSADRALRTISLDAFERVVRKTPVGDPEFWKGHPQGDPSGNRSPPPGYVGGNARNNWWLSVNAPDDTAQGRAPGAAGASTAYSEAVVKVSHAKMGDLVYIQNGVPYIHRLESGEGSPRQAPHGMVAITFSELETHYQQLLAQEFGK